MSQSAEFASAAGTASVLSGTFGPAARGEVTVQIRNVCHFFGEGELRKQVLFDNNLDLHAGEIVIMTGPSGSGKTTLLTLIGGLRSVQQGSLKILDTELRGLSQTALGKLRQNIGFIFQAHNLFASLTALQNVRMALELTDRPAQEMNRMAKEMLEAVGLGHRVNYKPAALSGGQRQRVAIARALVNRPKLILADEPTAALDKASGRDVVELLEKFAQENGCTIMMVTHDSRILDAADRIVNMVDGRVISDVMVDESAKVCEFLGKCPVFDQLTAGTLSELADKMLYEKQSAGEVIIRQGDPGDKFYLIRSGDVIVESTTDGKTEQLAELHEGAFFGEAALLTGEPRNATVRATSDVELYTLAKDEFQRVLDTSATFSEELRRALFQRA